MKKVTEFLFLEDEEVTADFTIVLGMNRWERPLDRAMKLYHRGLAGKLVLTGGWNAALGGTEADFMASHAEANGIPSADVLRENNARNTRENFENSLALIEKLHDRDALSINIVSIGFHTRRALMTARDVLPSYVRFGVASYPSLHYANAAWFLSAQGRRDVQGEVLKLNRYFPGSVPDAVLRQVEMVSP